MAGQKRRKPCKSGSSEKLCAVGDQPSNLHTGKLLEVINERRRSLRKKLKLGEESSKTEHVVISSVQDLLKEVPLWKKNSLHQYATPAQEVTNSSSHVPSRSFSGAIPRDDSPIAETSAVPQKSLGKRSLSIAYPPVNKMRSVCTSSNASIMPEVSLPPKHNLDSHASTKAPRMAERDVFSEVNPSSKKRLSPATAIKSPDHARANLVREGHDSPADLTCESLVLRTLKELRPENDKPRAEDNLMRHLFSLREQYPEDNEPIAEDNLLLLLQSLSEQYPEDDEPIEQCPKPMEQFPCDDESLGQCLEDDEQLFEDDKPIDDLEDEKEPQVTTPVSVEESQGLVGKRGPTKLKGVTQESDDLIVVKFNTKGKIQG